MRHHFARAVLVLAALLTGCSTDSSGLGSVDDLDVGSDTTVSADTREGDGSIFETEPDEDSTTPDTGAPPDTSPPPDTMPPPDAGCAAPNTECGTACVNTQTTFEHCGSCGRNCSSELKYSTSCFEGNCECKSGEGACSGECKVRSEDAKNCSSCGNSCGKEQWCRAGACECRPGLTVCGSACVDTKGDLFNCGSCGNECANNQRCVSGSCVANTNECPTGQTACSADKGRSSCFNLQTDATHCGGCGTTCAADQLCVAGKCAKYAPAAGCLTCGGCTTCTALLGSGARCCPALLGHTYPTCVDATACP